MSRLSSMICEVMLFKPWSLAQDLLAGMSWSGMAKQLMVEQSAQDYTSLALLLETIVRSSRCFTSNK